MSKVLVELRVPVARASWDVWLPDDLTMGEVAELLGSMVPELSDGLYRPQGDIALCDPASGLIYSARDTVRAAGLEMGSRLLVI